MDEQIIITSGKKYIDIDAYAGIFAYKMLLQSLGYHNVFAVTTATENKSISPIIKDLGFEFDNISLNKNTKFIILDVSNPDFFDKIVKHENILEIIDHHTGYEEYWKNFKYIKTNIDFIGSICTIIYEKFEKENKTNLLNTKICKLLIAGILDNTLNLKSNITTARDIQAYNKLLQIGNIDENWYIEYFNSCYKNIEDNIEIAIKNDIKIETINHILPPVFGQLIVLDKKVIFNNIEKVYNIFKDYNSWVLNVICLTDGKSYLFFNNIQVRRNLELLFNTTTSENFIVLDKFMLRKEIMKLARENF